MTVCLSVLAAVVAMAAAARSTWSPCGLSMLSSITPLSERARGGSYRSTATWFVLGATVGGASLGAVMALSAVGVHALHLGPAVLGLIALAAALLSAASDAGVGGFRLPIHRRQVNERWLDQYRPWVYGGGFGWQIGSGLATYITTAAVYLMIVLSTLTGRPMVALAVGVGFGILRGLAVCLTWKLTSPSQLRAFHRRFVDTGPRVVRAVVAVEVGAAAMASAAVGLLPLLATVLVVAGATAACSVIAVRRGRVDEPAVAPPPSSVGARSGGADRTIAGHDRVVPDHLVEPVRLAAHGVTRIPN